MLRHFHDSIHFNRHFPGEPGLANTRMFSFWILLVYWMEMVVTTGAIRRANGMVY